MSRPILFEVIAMSAADAVSAVAGGADRLELVSDMAADGLTPGLAEFAAIRAAVDVPLRVMLRAEDSFAAGDLDALRRDVAALRTEGAEEFVMGFLTASGEVDLAGCRAVLEVIDGCAWTFHRAIDRAPDREAARVALGELPGLDTFLTAGSAAGVATGMDVLQAEAARTCAARARAGAADGGEGAGYRARMLIGGGLDAGHVPGLLAAGADAFHVGTAVRAGRRWDAPVDATSVRRWRELVDQPVVSTV
jgi:copper homeostasis protein